MAPAKIGPYPIEREVGRGGMGVVYLGRDLRLDRPVAIKVLPEIFSRDPDRLARFEREARLLAALSHPNIAGIYGLEESDGQRFLALEYVEGLTLAEVLNRGALPLQESLDVCRQIAAALEAAHEAGIVHRDLKPGNVKITPGDAVKVLDFGLAKGAASDSDSSSGLSQSPTLTRGATGAGVVLGTAAYMSPEQARGKSVDRRTDIWSFGCVLYECLTGAQAFEGETATDIIAAILKGEPDWSRLPKAVPEKLRELLARCLEKDPKRRLRDIGDARIELEELLGSRISAVSRVAAASAAAAGAGPARQGSTPARASAMAALVLVGVGLGAAGWALLGMGRPEAPPMRFAIQSPPHVNISNDPNDQAISPDGRTLAFATTDSTGQSTLWLRPLSSFVAHELPGTKGAALPFWAPDGKQVGFFADGKLKRIHVDGTSPELVCDAPSGRGASWSSKGIIVFAPAPGGPLCQVRASGGTPEAVTTLDAAHGESAHRWPSFLPDGDHFTYAAIPMKQGQFACFIGSTRSKERAPLFSATTAPIYAAPGYLIFTRNVALQAQKFDTGRRRVTGDPFTLGDPPGASSFTASPGASVSRNGVLAWMTAGNPNTRLVWLDRSGREVSSVGIPVDQWGVFSISHDGRRAVIEQRSTSGSTDLWLLNLERGDADRLTFGQGNNAGPIFSPDDKQVLFGSTRRGVRDLYTRASDGSGTDHLLYHSSVQFKDVNDCSPDGKWTVFSELDNESGWNLRMIPSAGGAPVPLLVTPFNEQNAQVSPDGKWLLYESDESGSNQSYVQSFPGGGNREQVAKSGAYFATWVSGGREILLLRPDLSVWSIPVETGPSLRFGAPRLLCQLPPNSQGWGPSPDGQRFLVDVPAEKTTPGISVAVNWRAGRERP